jgi:putative ABC transport system permease protein
VYVPHAVLPYRTMTLVVRASVSAASLVPAIRQAVWSLDREQPASAIRTGEDIVAGSLAQSRLSLALVAFFAAVALALALIGLTGVTSYAVVQRTHEIGVRMALGAPPAAIGRLVVVEGMSVVAVGLAAGLVLALIFSRLLSTLLYGIRPIDAGTYAQVLLLLVATACAALYVPARRAARVDPAIALRWE